MNVQPTDVLGIDLGNTIAIRGIPIKDAFKVIQILRGHFGENIRIVSRVNEEQEVRARAFVTSEHFQTSTGIPLDKVHFCRERADKGEICAKHGITHFIDDRPEVMAAMPPSVHTKILFRPDKADLATFRDRLSNYHIVESWLQIKELYCNSK